MTPVPPLLPEDAARFAGVDAPPRVQRLLGALLGLARQSLTAPLTLTVVELERELMRDAERARNSQVQADLLAQARQVHPFADGFSHRFLDELTGALQALFAAGDTLPSVPTPAPAAAPRPPPGMLTLVDDTDIDRDIVLAEIVRREMLRSANALQLLGQRLAVLAARPALDPEQVPFGPAGLCQLLRRIGEQGALELEAQLALYRSFERQVLDRLGELLERANLLLDHEGVLPGLVYTPYLARSAATRRIVTGPGRSSEAPAGRRTVAAPLTAWNGGAASGSWSAMMHEVLGGSHAGGQAVPAPQPADAGTGIGTPAMATELPPPLPVDLAAPAMTALHQLLAGARHGADNVPRTAVGTPPSAAHMGPGTGGNTPLGGPLGERHAAARQADEALPDSPSPPAQPHAAAPAPAPAEAVPSATVDAVLSQLQARIAQGARPHSMADMHDALLAQLRAEHGERAALTVKDNDTLELLGLLFQQIQQQQRPTAPTQDLVGRLQVPLVRAALADPGFFVRDEHPAREFLNTIAEAGAAWLGEDDLDPQLAQKLGAAVDTVVAEYRDDPAVFSTANEQVQEHFRTAVHKAELAERRHVEAARGRERLDVARQQATARIDAACEQSAPPRFVQTLLKQAWADVLTLAQLRHGEESEQWKLRLAETQQIAAVTAQAPGSDPHPADALATSVEEALLQVGYHAEEATAIARRLSSPGGEDDTSSRTELTARLKSRARLGGQADGSDARRQAPLARSTVEEDCYRQLCALPFGTWFEFVTNQQGDLRRQRLSWYSLVTDHALFVNARGQKVAEHTLDALARLMAQDQARIVTEDKGRLVDRAWQATLRTLRALAGGMQGDGA